jgi:hypothetical protein
MKAEGIAQLKVILDRYPHADIIIDHLVVHARRLLSRSGFRIRSVAYRLGFELSSLASFTQGPCGGPGVDFPQDRRQQ